MTAWRVGETVQFAEDPNPFTVQAVSLSGRWVACTRGWTDWDRQTATDEEAEYYDGNGWPENGDCLYTVIDTVAQVRGPDNAVGSLGYETREECEEAIALFEFGYFKHSQRSRPIELRLASSPSAPSTPGGWEHG